MWSRVCGLRNSAIKLLLESLIALYQDCPYLLLHRTIEYYSAHSSLKLFLFEFVTSAYLQN